MRETSRLFILISAYEGGVGHVYSQSRGRGQRKIFWGGAPDPEDFCPPIKIPGGATEKKLTFVVLSAQRSNSVSFSLFNPAKSNLKK